MLLQLLSSSGCELQGRLCTMRIARLVAVLFGLGLFQIGCAPGNVPSMPADLKVAISPATATIASGATLQFTATVQGSTNTDVLWSASAGAVSNSGLFSAPAVSETTSVTVTATSSADSKKQASAIVTVTASAPPSPVNTTAGGLTALPAAEALGENQVANAGFESGSAPWTLPSCFSIDAAHAHQGTQSLLFSAGAGCGSAVAATTTVARDPAAVRSYTLQGWVMTSTGGDLEVKITVHDESAGGDIIGSTDLVAPGPVWTFIQRKDIDLLPVHDGDTLLVEAVVQGTTGMAWFDDVQFIEQKPLPISTFLLYPNYKGFLWGNGPQMIRLQVKVPNPTQMQVKAVLQAEGGNSITTLLQPAQSTQELDFDGSGLPPGSYLINSALLDSNGNTIATYPAYRVKKVDPSFQGSLVNYIDIDNFLVRKGQKRFVWGVYDRWSSHRCGAPDGIPCLSTNQDVYLQIPGFNNLTTLGNYADTKLNAEMSILPFVGVNVTATNDQLTPWLTAVDNIGVGHLQIVNNWFDNARGRPAWQQNIPAVQTWEMLTSTQAGKAGGLGYYTFDEPTTDNIPTVFSQWPTLSAGDPGGVEFGTLARVNQVFRWRDMADIMSCDPYPVGNVPDANDYSYGARSSPPMLRTSIWTREVVRQSYGSRAVWMVLQLFDLQGNFPTYTQLKMQVYKAIINGATGILWWGFVSQQGIEYEWYVAGNQQPYFDFQRLSQEVMTLEPILVSPPQPALVASVSDPKIEYLVKADSNRILIFASNFSDVAVGNVTFTLSPALKISPVPVQVYSEGRTLPLGVGPSFTDSFGSNDVHVYEVSVQ
jgi:hypothetical protein